MNTENFIESHRMCEAKQMKTRLGAEPMRRHKQVKEKRAYSREKEIYSEKI